jgi:hypothetical protein
LDGGGLCADCGEIKPRRGRFVKVSGIELFLWHSLLCWLDWRMSFVGGFSCEF